MNRPNRVIVDPVATTARTIKKRSNGVETAKKILAVAIQEMEIHGPAQFNLDRVIENSKVSRSSLYHHYGNREGLIIAVELDRLKRNLIDNDQATRRMLETLSSSEEALSLIELGIRSAASSAQRQIRAQRIASFAASQHAPAIHEALRRLQVSAAIEFAETLRLAASRGFMDPVEPIEGTAHFIQSFLIGRVLVDVLDDNEADEAWHAAAMTSIRALLRPR